MERMKVMPPISQDCKCCHIEGVSRLEVSELGQPLLVGYTDTRAS